MKIENFFKKVALALCAALPLVATMGAGTALAQSQSGTTLAAYKTVGVCSVSASLWRYYGEIAVWNEGAVDTQGLTINDRIQTKVGNVWTDTYPVPLGSLTQIPAGTTLATATVFPYSIEAPPLLNGIRNAAQIQITNHSGSLGVPKGPEPKATFTGNVLPCPTTGGCSYTQGYWGNKPGVIWPEPYHRDAAFFLSGQTWQAVMDTAVNVAPGYYQLAHQYIAAVLNQANHALVPSGVQDTLNLAQAWLAANPPAVCSLASQCGVQKDWAAVLASYNEGNYPDGPAHCGDE